MHERVIAYYSGSFVSMPRSSRRGVFKATVLSFVSLLLAAQILSLIATARDKEDPINDDPEMLKEFLKTIKIPKTVLASDPRLVKAIQVC